MLFTSDNQPLPYKRDLNNFQPRIGVAFQLRPTTMLRGGYGMYYLPTFDTGFNNGFGTSTQYVSSIDNGLTPANRLSDPYPNGISSPTGSTLGLGTLLGQSVTVGDTERRVIPKVHQFSFGVQQELPWRMLFDVSYVGTRTYDLNTARNINDIAVEQLALGNGLNALVPNPLQGLLPGTPYNVTLDRTSVGRDWYNALQLRSGLPVPGERPDSRLAGPETRILTERQ